ncbi:MAG: alpha/beta hydrolase [Leptolyngbyaceae cyanobacterium SM2_3_12]|nr:alpha/beta hydrolase [Leptolyngbyaceae cyanobacterium SM2_3_12]
MSHLRRRLQLIGAFIASLAIVVAVSGPLQAAETLFLDYGPLSRSVPAAEVVAFAEEGAIGKNLAFFYQSAEPRAAGRS